MNLRWIRQTLFSIFFFFILNTKLTQLTENCNFIAAFMRWSILLLYHFRNLFAHICHSVGWHFNDFCKFATFLSNFVSPFFFLCTFCVNDPRCFFSPAASSALYSHLWRMCEKNVKFYYTMIQFTKDEWRSRHRCTHFFPLFRYFVLQFSANPNELASFFYSKRWWWNNIMRAIFFSVLFCRLLLFLFCCVVKIE